MVTVRVKKWGNNNGNSLQIICLPYAGGHAMSFMQFSSKLPPEWEVLAIEPPGHGFSKDTPLDELNEMVELYFSALLPLLGKQVVIYGHSLGGVVGYCLVRKLEENGIVPIALFMGASPLPDFLKKLNFKKDKHLVLSLRNMGLQEDERNHTFNMLNIDIIRADLNALLKVSIRKRPLLNTPMHIFLGTQDKFVPKDHLMKWSNYGHIVQFTSIEGGHMFILSNVEKLLEKIITLIDYYKKM
jgi:external thioesterase TEII